MIEQVGPAQMVLEFEDGSSLEASVVVEQITKTWPERDWSFVEFKIRAYEVKEGSTAAKKTKGKAGELIRCIRMRGRMKT